MQTVIGVRFKKAGKIYYFSPGMLEISKGDHVIVETARGLEYGLTVLGPREVEDSAVVLPLKIVQRKASEQDDRKVAENKRKEREAFEVGEKKIAEHHLPMKLVEVEYTFDINKIVFYFTADGRIDFRDLVKDLAGIFRTRIELRQIGVRDEAKLMGGIGCCGRPLCCATFLGDFAPVSIRMAKEQNLSLNPTKISGICGRLMCCLKYESECYSGEGCPHQKRAPIQIPVQGSHVATESGEGKVISVNGQKRLARILLDDGETLMASWDDLLPIEDGGENVAPSDDKRPSRKNRSHREGQDRQKGNRPPKDRKDRPEKFDKKEKPNGEKNGERGKKPHRPHPEKAEKVEHDRSHKPAAEESRGETAAQNSAPKPKA